MLNDIRRAVILAAGRGTRMGEMTQSIPKPMLNVAGRPMLEHILERLSAAGIQRFFIVVGFHREAIESYFEGSNFEIEFAVQDPVNGTGSAALMAEAFAAGQPFLLTFGDILCGAEEYTGAIAKLGTDADGVLAVKAVDDPWQGAAVYEENGRITSIVEKPPRGTSHTNWNSAGFYCFRASLFPYLAVLKPSVRNEFELTSAVGAMIESNLTLRISAIEGEWRDVGRPEDLDAVNSKLS